MGGKGVYIALIYLVSSYAPQMGMPTSPWDDLSFALKGKVTCGAVMCANWMTDRLHQIGVTVHAPMAQEIDDALAADPDIYLMGHFVADDTNLDSIHVRKTIYLAAPFVGILRERDLTPAKAWSCLRGSIVNASTMVGFRLTIDWLQVALTRKSR